MTEPLETQRHHLQRTEVGALRNQSDNLRDQLNELHGQVAAMCERLDPNETQPRDTWGLRDLLLGRERRLEALRKENAELKRINDDWGDALDKCHATHRSLEEIEAAIIKCDAIFYHAHTPRAGWIAEFRRALGIEANP